MALTLDLRSPLLVLVAQFNPAIFEFPWIAKHLLDADEGAAVEALEVIMQVERSLQRLQFFEGVALNVQMGRTDLLVRDGSEASFEAAETRLIKLLSVLPHTPLTAIGCNFRFNDPTPSQGILDLFDTPEEIEGSFGVNSRQLTAQLQMDNGVLNLSRTLSAGICQFSFNYHRDEADPERYIEFLPGMIRNHLDHAREILKSLYGYDKFETVGFANGLDQREQGDEPAFEAEH